jgi:hypothetical protein
MTEKTSEGGILKRMLLGVMLGAIIGFACAVTVAYLRGIDFSSDPVATNQWLWPRVLRYAILEAAPLGAIYMALASITLLRAEKLVSAALAILAVTIIFSLVGEGFIAPLSPLWLDASLGFWLSCLAIYVQRDRRGDQSGWESYF